MTKTRPSTTSADEIPARPDTGSGAPAVPSSTSSVAMRTTLSPPGCRTRFSAVQQFGEPLGVGLGVVAVAVVEQHVGLLGVVGQGAHLGRPLGQLGLAVAVAEPLVDVLAVPLGGVAVHPDDRQAR